MNNDIEKALQNIRTNGGRYSRAERYYNGDHNLAFATEKFQNAFGNLFREFALNLCPVVCDAVRDKLRIRDWNAGDSPAHRVDIHDGSTARRRSPAGARAFQSVWQRSRMGLRSGEVHKEALRSGDAYVIVWPD